MWGGEGAWTAGGVTNRRWDDRATGAEMWLLTARGVGTLFHTSNVLAARISCTPVRVQGGALPVVAQRQQASRNPSLQTPCARLLAYPTRRPRASRWERGASDASCFLYLFTNARPPTTKKDKTARKKRRERHRDGTAPMRRKEQPGHARVVCTMPTPHRWRALAGGSGVGGGGVRCGSHSARERVHPSKQGIHSTHRHAHAHTRCNRNQTDGGQQTSHDTAEHNPMRRTSARSRWPSPWKRSQSTGR